MRRAALPPGGPFDAGLRFGEDVDLLWRLHDAGWRLRYDPRTVVAHEEPHAWRAWLRRRYDYGTSAGPLARRHPTRLAPLVLPPWPTAAWLALAAGRPGMAALAAAVPAVRLHRRLRRSGGATTESARAAAALAGKAVVAVGGGLGGAGAVLTAPVLLGLLVPRRTRRTAGVLLLAPPLIQYLQRRPALDPLRWSGLRLAEDLGYAAGVWTGAWSVRSLQAVRPRRATSPATARPRHGSA